MASFQPKNLRSEQVRARWRSLLAEEQLKAVLSRTGCIDYLDDIKRAVAVSYILGFEGTPLNVASWDEMTRILPKPCLAKLKYRWPRIVNLVLIAEQIKSRMRIGSRLWYWFVWVTVKSTEIPMDKITALLKSRRFWIAVAGVVAVALHDTLGLDEQQTLELAGIVIAWILGDSLRETK